MSSSHSGLSSYDPTKVPNAFEMKFAVLVSEYNTKITFSLRDGCIEALLRHSARKENIETHYVPGAYELTSAAHMLASRKKPDAIICLGCVIKGETPHNDYINHSVAQGLTQLSIKHDIPVIFGVLTPNTERQALDRSGGKHGNKGTEAAIAAIKMIHFNKSL